MIVREDNFSSKAHTNSFGVEISSKGDNIDSIRQELAMAKAASMKRLMQERSAMQGSKVSLINSARGDKSQDSIYSKKKLRTISKVSLPSLSIVKGTSSISSMAKATTRAESTKSLYDLSASDVVPLSSR